MDNNKNYKDLPEASNAEYCKAAEHFITSGIPIEPSSVWQFANTISMGNEYYAYDRLHSVINTITSVTSVEEINE